MIIRRVEWNHVKSRRLKRMRGVSFEEIINAQLVDVLEHPGREGQRIMVFKHKDYYWAVPFVMEDEKIFLKTIYPSRKLKKRYNVE